MSIWSRLRLPEIDGLDRNTPVVLPVAAVEQHGPHLPLNTDCVIAEAMAERLDHAMGGRLLILPTQSIGCSKHHMPFVGSLTLEHETFRRAVMETIRSVVSHGFQRVLILNCHGGNQAINAVICEQAGQMFPEADVVVSNWWGPAAAALKEISDGPLGSTGHACEFETSLMLALEPDLVDMSCAVDDGHLHPVEPLQMDLFNAPVAGHYRPFDVQTSHGVYGKPSLASAEKGEQILSTAVAGLRELLGSMWPE